MTDPIPMRAITVLQPMAFAIASGAKTRENRYTDFGYRGPLAIHSGAKVNEKWLALPSIQELTTEWRRTHGGLEPEFTKRAIVAVTNLVGAHESDGECCKPFGMSRSWHLELAGTVALRRPIPIRGQQGLWTVPPEIDAFLRPLLS